MTEELSTETASEWTSREKYGRRAHLEDLLINRVCADMAAAPLTLRRAF